MSDQQAELLKSFRAFIQAAEDGAPIPPVDKHDLKALHQLCVDRAKRYCGKDGVISIEMTARACSPGSELAGRLVASYPTSLFLPPGLAR